MSGIGNGLDLSARHCIYGGRQAAILIGHLTACFMSTQPNFDDVPFVQLPGMVALLFGQLRYPLHKSKGLLEIREDKLLI